MTDHHDKNRPVDEQPYEDWHVCRSWNPPDPFAPGCGCELLPCGHVDGAEATKRACPEHGVQAAKSTRSAHRPRFCPTLIGRERA